jgi:hypothetical protein
MQRFFVWDLVVYLVESVVFPLDGLQARCVADTLALDQWESLASCLSGGVVSALICVRFVAGSMSRPMFGAAHAVFG